MAIVKMKGVKKVKKKPTITVNVIDAPVVKKQTLLEKIKNLFFKNKKG